MFFSEENKPFLENQVDAVTRAIFVIGKKRKISFQGAVRGLAKAEKEASFFCGFELLNNDEVYKEALKKHLIENGFIFEDAEGYAVLTLKGKNRSKKGLPPEIETCLA